MYKKLVLATLVIGALAAPAQAAMNCGSMLEDHSSMISKMTKASMEKRAALRRMAMRGYDYCMAGDELNATKFFDMISREHN